ncbi:MAG: hypothetical protein U1E05_09410, partial [Patescibacteria group bacterium]|nr:hypothetical protein [Patescibacteria group bacterium]
MVSISKCPRCHQFVSLPEGVGLEAIVRCPFCDAEYALSASLPPALILVEGVAAPAPEAPGPEAASAETVAAVAPVQEELALQSPALPGFSVASEAGATDAPNVTHVPDVTDVGDFELATSPADEASAESAFPGFNLSGEASAESMALPEEQTAAASEEAAPEQPSDPAGGGGMFDFLNGGGPSPAATAAAANEATSPSATGTDAPFWDASDTAGAPSEAPKSLSASRPRRRKEKSVVKEMVGAIVGGFVGLSLGYYGLNYFGGDRFDFLNVWLPGVQHT